MVPKSVLLMDGTTNVKDIYFIYTWRCKLYAKSKNRTINNNNFDIFWKQYQI